MSIKSIWHKISFLGLNEDQEFSHREVVLLNRLVFVACMVILPVIPLEVILNGWELVPYEVLILVISFGTLFFSYKGWHTFAKIYFFFVAVGSQANVGGAASAPIVASAFSPSLAPVGVLLAVLGYAVGTFGAIICTIMMQWLSQG